MTESNLDNFMKKLSTFIKEELNTSDLGKVFLDTEWAELKFQIKRAFRIRFDNCKKKIEADKKFGFKVRDIFKNDQDVLIVITGIFDDSGTIIGFDHTPFPPAASPSWTDDEMEIEEFKQFLDSGTWEKVEYCEKAGKYVPVKTVENH